MNNAIFICLVRDGDMLDFTECNCLSDGAVGCDDKTGRCLCLPGVTGLTCDRCLDRWVLVPGQGCQGCIIEAILHS